MKIISAFLFSSICIQLYACNSNTEINKANNLDNTVKIDSMKLKITVGSSAFTATLQNSATVNAFQGMLPLTIIMVELNGNEKYFDLSRSLTTNASNPGTIKTGDLMLYGSSTLVLFYKTFSTSYNYTRLGRIDDVTGLAAAVGSGDVTVTFELP